MKTVRHFGETIPLATLVRHYRAMARDARWPYRRELYRDLLKMAIREYREQSRHTELEKAA